MPSSSFRDGYILRSASSDAARKTGASFRTKGAPLKIPAPSLAAVQDSSDESRTGCNLAPGVWFNEEVREMTIFAEQYDFALSLLLLENVPRYARREEIISSQ